ncbi:ABC transporter substrate-binding protein [Aliikangiella coralliicola]|uniref:ABC transporter substrate-binding protein n=1 Tax=Aliikangiella coralliicola TaxID=2592383 RepID=A0A545UHY8_9GAMM|nr:ABC transporter substrate-binding protein [Aliikangiella coralliicola]TQV89068.1 ABC transporter substrate-binding protein [Aliikangiella coralliicola]
MTHLSLGMTTLGTTWTAGKNLIIILSLTGMVAWSPLVLTSSLLDLSLRELMNVKVQQSRPQGLFWSRATAPTSSTINIGLLVPFTAEKKASVEIIAAAEFAAAEINSLGGINGKKLAIIRGDDNLDEETGIKVASRMIKNHDIKALIGPVASQHVLAVAKAVTIPAGIPLFAPAANANELSELKDNDLVFRVTATNRQITDKMVEFLSQNQLNKVAVFYQRDVFGRELYQGLSQSIKLSGGEVVFSESLSKSVTFDSYSLAYEIKQAQKLGSEVLMLVVPSGQFDSFFEQIAKHWQGKLPILLLPEHANLTIPETPKFSRSVCVFSVVPTQSNKDLRIIKGITKTLDVSHTSYTAVFVNDLTYLIASALSLAERKSTEFSTSLRQITANNRPTISTLSFANFSKQLAQHNTTSFLGQSGPIHFDGKGDNKMVQLVVREFHKVYGAGCDRKKLRTLTEKPKTLTVLNLNKLTIE